jgi:hypothetical protein
LFPLLLRLTLQEAIKRRGYAKYHMDVWSFQELQQCRDLMYPEMELSGVKGRWDIWGGVPRYVLDKVLEEDQQEIHQAIDRSSIDIVRQALGGSSSHHEISDLLLHLRVEADFMSIRMDWASDWVAERFAQRAWQQEKDRLIEFLSVSHGLPELGTLRGRLWEGVCHDRLAAGGVYRVKRLGEGLEGVSIEQVVLEPCTSRLVFDDLREVEGARDQVYCKPRAANFAAIDSMRQPGSLFQITVAKKHGVNGDGLERATACMRAPRQDIHLYFVVTPPLFESFKQQPLLGSRRAADIKQYALEVTWADVR